MEQMEQQMVTVKVAAEITGLTIKSIRFYEKVGLIAPARCSSSGYRLLKGGHFPASANTLISGTTVFPGRNLRDFGDAGQQTARYPEASAL